jgi:hypothetical protein
MKAHLLGCSLIAAVAIVWSAAASDARDRPGAPNEVAAQLCGWHLYGVGDRPDECVSFQNTAKERVSFWMEWTLNGAPMPADFLNLKTRCLDGTDLGGSQSGPIECTVLPRCSISAHVCSPQYTERFGVRQGFAMRGVEFDSDYCFRFKSITDNGIVSQDWSPWKCAHTPPVPLAPRKRIHAPKVSVFPGNPGREGDRNLRPTPTRVAIEWTNKAADGSIVTDVHGEWVVQWKKNNDRLPADMGWGAVSGDFRGDGWRVPYDSNEHSFEFVGLEAPDWRYLERDSALLFRICQVNFSGKICSGPTSTLGILQQPGALEESSNVPVTGKIAGRVGTHTRNAGTRLGQYLPAVLLEPQSNQQVTSKTLRVRMEAPKPEANLAEVTLAWVSHPMGVTEIIPWRVSVDQLVAGARVPDEVIGKRRGIFDISVRVVEPYEGQSSKLVRVNLTDTPAGPFIDPNIRSGKRLVH